MTGYFLAPSSGDCVSCSSGCATCFNSTFCLSCQSGRYFTNSSCEICPSECQECDGASSCSLCYQGFYLSNNTCLSCYEMFVGCVSCSVSECFACSLSMGHFLYANGSCGYCESSIPNCQQCHNQSLCISCHFSSYLAFNNTCLPCSDSLTHCQSCANSSYCDICEGGFYSSNGACLACPLGCDICSSNTTCLKPSAHYITVNSSTTFCGTIIPGCYKCITASICTGCISGYYLTNSSSC